MPLPRPTTPLPRVLCLTAAALLTGCGGDEPAADLGDATDELVEASRERFEASQEYREKAEDARAAATGLREELTRAAPALEAEIQGDLAAADAGLDEARAALGVQADDLFTEIQAAIAERRYPQANAALETLRGIPDANPGMAPDLTDRLTAIEASLAEAQDAEESLGSARAAIDAAKATAERATEAVGGEVGSPPAEDGSAFEK